MKKTFSILFVSILSIQLWAQDVSLDKKLGKEGAVQVEQQIGLYEHKEASPYVDEIGRRLLDELTVNPFEFEFHIINMPEPNAFALPGGHVYVSRGLLAMVNSEDELACVMGHEIIHVMERHSVARMKKGILPAILQLPGTLIGGSVGGAINTPISLVSQLGLSNYSRGQEKDADRVGVRISAGAGYDPKTLADILSRMSQEMELLSGEAEKKNYLSDHPFTPKRVEYLEKLTFSLKQQPKANIVNGRNVLQKLDGILYGTDPAQGVFNDSLFLHPDMGISMVFPGGWQTENSAQAVGAMQKDGEALVTLSLEQPGISADSAAKKMAETLQKKNVEFEEKKDIKIGGYPARTITFFDVQGEKKVKYDIVWIEKDTTVFRLMGAAFPDFTTPVHEAIMSFRSISKEERKTIFQQNIKVVNAKKGESLEALSTRTSNEWSVAMTAIANGFSEDVILREGELVKVVVKSGYKGRGE